MPALDERQEALVQELQRRRQADPSQFTGRQQQLMDELLRRTQVEQPPTISQASPSPPTDFGSQGVVQMSARRGAEVAGSGFNRGLVDFAEFVGMPVDMVSAGLRKAGVPIPEKPFLGSTFNKELAESLLPPIANPETGQERILFRIAREVGSTAPATGAAIGSAKKAEQVGAGIMAGIRDELAKIPPGKLLLVEQALAGSAGFGAGILTEIFPEGGPFSDLLGELLGTFGGSTVASLVRGARQATGLAVESVKTKSTEPILRAAASKAEKVRQTLSGEGSKRQELGEGLQKVTSPDAVEQGLRETEAIQKEIPNFRPTTSQAFGSPGVVALERGFEARDPRLVQDFELRRQANRDAIRDYIDEQAPTGNKEAFVQRLQAQREQSEALLDASLDRTQSAIEIAKGDISARTARVLDDAERRMLRADTRADEALANVRPRLTAPQAGEIIRREYLEELDAFRLEASRRYENVDPQNLVIMPSQSAKDVADAVQRGFNPLAERTQSLPTELIDRIQALPDNVPFNTLRELRSDILANIKELRAGVPKNDNLLRRMGQLLDGVEFNIDELVTDGRLRRLYEFQADRYQELVSWYRQGATRLKQGMAAKLRVEDGGGRFAVFDEHVADRFLKSETPLEDFLQSVGGRPQAQAALQERIRLDFVHHVVDPGTGRINPQAYARWARDRAHALASFPELQAQFANAERAQQVANQVRRDAELMRRDPDRTSRLLGDRAFGELNEAERAHAAILREASQSRKQWQKATSSLYLKGNDIDRVSRSIISSSAREEKIASVLKEIGPDPIARQGFIRALWDASLDKFSVSALDANENPTVMARKIRQFMLENEGWMRQLFGPEKLKALDTAKKALAKIEISGKSPQPGGSDTIAKLFSSLEDVGMPLLARFYAHQRHVVSRGFIALEQVGRRVFKALGRFSDEQATALLEEAFFDPKVAETLMKAGRGVHEDHIAHRLRLHLLSMNQGDAE